MACCLLMLCVHVIWNRVGFIALDGLHLPNYRSVHTQYHIILLYLPFDIFAPTYYHLTGLVLFALHTFLYFSVRYLFVVSYCIADTTLHNCLTLLLFVVCSIDFVNLYKIHTIRNSITLFRPPSLGEKCVNVKVFAHEGAHVKVFVHKGEIRCENGD